jgi:hypothetical protein
MTATWVRSDVLTEHIEACDTGTRVLPPGYFDLPGHREASHLFRGMCLRTSFSQVTSTM